MSYSSDLTVMALKDLHLEGNIIPMEWFAHLKFDSGKPDMNAILILSDIVYWYRPVVVRDEQTGMVTGYRKKFKSDLLQKSYQHYADLFGLSKRQVSDAIIRLEERGLIKRVLRTIETPSLTLQNILFIALNVQKLAEINASVGGVTFYRETPHDRKGDLPRSIGTPPPIERDTYTENTTKTPTEITTETHADARGDISRQMLDVWNQALCPLVPVQLTPSRQARLRSILQQYFQGNLEQWQSFCSEITQSPFLMGQGQRKWRVTLDWILEPHNLQKTLEGNYKNAAASPTSDTSLTPEETAQKVQQHIESFSDPALQQFAKTLLKFISVETYMRWFADLQMEKTGDQRLVLWFSCRAARDYVERRYSSEIGVAVRVVHPVVEWIEYDVRTPSAASSETSLSSEFPPFCSPQEGGRGELPPDAHPSTLNVPGGSSSDEPSRPFFPDGRGDPALHPHTQPYFLSERNLYDPQSRDPDGLCQQQP